MQKWLIQIKCIDCGFIFIYWFWLFFPFLQSVIFVRKKRWNWVNDKECQCVMCFHTHTAHRFSHNYKINLKTQKEKRANIFSWYHVLCVLWANVGYFGWLMHGMMHKPQLNKHKFERQDIFCIHMYWVHTHTHKLSVNVFIASH